MKTTYTLEDFSVIMSATYNQMNIENFNKATPEKYKHKFGDIQMYKQALKGFEELGNYSDIDIVLYLSVTKIKPKKVLGTILYPNHYRVVAHINIENGDYKNHLLWIFEENIEYESIKKFLEKKSLKDIKGLKKFIEGVKHSIRIFG